MQRVISVSVGELVLKKGNRAYFENKLIGQMKRAIGDVGFSNFYKDQGKIYIEADYEDFDIIINRLKKVFGLVYISPCIKVDKSIEKIKKACILAMQEEYELNKNISFKVETNRSDKQFEFKSPEISRMMGGEILKSFNDLKVDVHSPDVTVNIDIKQNVYVYTKKIEGYRGLPVGSNGRGLLLLSGGIDSPVAGFTMAKRGVQIDCVHYHSYPFTSDRSEEKVIELAKILSRYVGKINFYSINILNIQKEINKNCPANEMTIISRRFMMRIANKIAKTQNYQALVTGESLGQVASQTIEGLTVTTDVVDIPILRPLIGIDKIDIIDIARDIETYETSILPFEDCCTVFLPKHPVINPKVEDIRRSEEALNIEELVENAINNMEIRTIE